MFPAAKKEERGQTYGKLQLSGSGTIQASESVGIFRLFAALQYSDSRIYHAYHQQRQRFQYQPQELYPHVLVRIRSYRDSSDNTRGDGRFRVAVVPEKQPEFIIQTGPPAEEEVFRPAQT
jgi:hypothetical protein